MTIKEQIKSEQRDISNNYSFLRLAKVREAAPGGKVTGEIEVEELSTGIVRSFPFSPARLTFPFIGNGWGIYGIPAKDDLVILGFLTDKVAVIIGYYPYNYYAQTTGNTNFTQLRALKSGEICIKSIGKAEIYWGVDGKIEIKNASTTIIVAVDGTVTINSSSIVLGDSATEQVVKGNLLKTWLDSHIHTTPSGPSGAPVTSLPSSTLSDVVKVK